jgi:TetR/AcrR family transcriptional regulator, fatty acid metabolism regulator protein
MKNNKETKILQAAEKVFFTKGFFPARMEDIADEAGVAKGTLYLYFKDKTSIYVHLMSCRLEEAVTVLESMQNAKMSATKKLEKIFDGWSHYYSQAKGITSFVSIENINLTTEIMKEMETQIKPKMFKFIDNIARIIKTGIVNHEFKKVNPQVASIFFLNTVRVVQVSHLYKINVKDGQEMIKEMFFNGIKLNKKESK